MSNPIEDLRGVLGERVRVDELLARHTTLRLGGPADLFVEAKTIPELVEYVRLARQSAVPFFILGNGSNILVLDKGIRGLVIENHCDEFSLEVTDSERAVLTAESGASLPGLASRVSRQGWSGLEWGIGVPGTIGGAIVGNAGAQGSSIADNLLNVTILDVRNSTQELPKTDCGFDYRTSRFKQGRRDIILTAEFELKQSEAKVCITRMNSFTEHRRRTQPTDPSIGSMFKNPTGDFAGRLIEQAGLKGKRVGNVEVSSIHANFFVNLGMATARDVMNLIQVVSDTVHETFGIDLQLEIEVVGE